MPHSVARCFASRRFPSLCFACRRGTEVSGSRSTITNTPSLHPRREQSYRLPCDWMAQSSLCSSEQQQPLAPSRVGVQRMHLTALSAMGGNHTKRTQAMAAVTGSGLSRIAHGYSEATRTTAGLCVCLPARPRAATASILPHSVSHQSWSPPLSSNRNPLRYPSDATRVARSLSGGFLTLLPRDTCTCPRPARTSRKRAVVGPLEASLSTWHPCPWQAAHRTTTLGVPSSVSALPMPSTAHSCGSARRNRAFTTDCTSRLACERNQRGRKAHRHRLAPPTAAPGVCPQRVPQAVCMLGRCMVRKLVAPAHVRGRAACTCGHSRHPQQFAKHSQGAPQCCAATPWTVKRTASPSPAANPWRYKDTLPACYTQTACVLNTGCLHTNKHTLLAYQTKVKHVYY